ncbi:hypothetical protein KI387_007609, partial [Taxus chinensis]
MADSLAISESLMLAHPGLKIDKYTIEVVFHPSMPDNSQHWQVFNNDNQLISFLEKVENFSELYFEESTSACRESVMDQDKESKGNDDICQLKGNKIPKGLVSLERLFNRHDRFVKNKRQDDPNSSPETEPVNLGSVEHPQFLNNGKCCTPEEKQKFVKLLKKYMDVLAWSYANLKSFKPKDVQHDIPLKED